MPPLLPRKTRWDALVVSSHRRRPSPTVQRVGVFALFTRLRPGSFALRPAVLHHRNSGPPVTRKPLRNTTKVHEQLLWRDLNPLVNQPVTACGQFTCESCRGRSSVTYGVQVFADDLETGAEEPIFSTCITFVRLDETGRKIPID